MRYLPDIKDIKQLEKNSQKKGSGIIYEELLGIWRFQYVYKKGSDQIDNISSSILQVISAKLSLKRENPDNQLNFEIKNSISFGILNIIFIGSAKIKGLKPLLLFYFENFSINIGNFPIIRIPLKKPEEKKVPFFSLIKINKENNWMCARGRGGGLAVWIKS